MTWVVFSYSLPPKGHSSPQVALWRRLRLLGAVSPTGGMHILPAREECLEAFQWLAEEVQHAKGEALVMRVEQFEGLSDAEEVIRVCKAQLSLTGCQACSERAQLHHMTCGLVACCVLERERYDRGVSIDKLKRRLSFNGHTLVLPVLEQLKSAA